MRPRIGVVIPTRRLLGLLPEAIASLQQQTVQDWVGVMVVHDSEMAGNRVIAESLAALDSRLKVVPSIGGDASGMRNAGIHYLRQDYPDLEFVYFLDADNKLEARALELYVAALASDDSAVWAYPDMEPFGQAPTDPHAMRRTQTNVPYSVARLLQTNFCDTGSLVRASFVLSGPVFDEEMKYGSEDWDFFRRLALLGPGLPAGSCGFRYRIRAGSHNSSNHVRRESSLADLLLEHRQVANWSSRKRLEIACEEFPVLVVNVETSTALLFRDSRSESITWVAAQDILSKCFESDYAVPWPRLCVFGDSRLLVALQSTNGPSCMLEIEHWSIKRGEASEIRVPDVDGRTVRVGVAMSTEALLASLQHVRSNRCYDSSMTLKRYTEVSESNRDLHLDLIRLSIARLLASNQVTQVMRGVAGLRVDTWLQPSASVLGQTRAQLGGASDRPFCSAVPREAKLVVGFALPWVVNGGVERAAIAMGRELRRQGIRTRLFVTRGEPAGQVLDLSSSFDDIIILTDSEDRPIFGAFAEDWSGGNAWHGVPLPRLSAALEDPMLGILGSVDALVIEHSSEALARAAALARAGVRLFVHIHTHDETIYGGRLGYSLMAVPFEHHIEGFLSSAPHWGGFLRAMGVPGEKIIDVPNAPFSSVTRRRHGHSGPLRVLYVGRKGPQKGLDRFLTIWLTCENKDIDWVVVNDGDELSSQNRTVVYRALPDVARLLEWADVVVNTSNWEGLPLLLLEARQAGACVLAPDLPVIGTYFRNDPGVALIAETSFEQDAVALLASWSVRPEIPRELGNSPFLGDTWEVSLRAFVQVLRMQHLRGESQIGGTHDSIHVPSQEAVL